MNRRYWSVEKIVYSDGCFEVLWGKWQDGTVKCLGVRWLKTDESYPCPKLYGGEVGWLVVPQFLTLPILNELLVRVVKTPSEGSVDALVDAMRECAERMGKVKV